MRLLHLAILVLVLMLPCCVIAAPTKALGQYSERVWRIDQGLPMNIVKAVAVGPDGDIWVGCQEGLARFDGVTFTLFTTGNAPGLASDNIHDLVTDREGNLWISSGGGLTRYRDGKFTTFVSAGDQIDPVHRMWLGNDGRLLVACDNSLRRYEHGQLIRLASVATLLSRNSDFDMRPFQDQTGAVWLVDSDNGLVRVLHRVSTPYPVNSRMIDGVMFTRQQSRGACADHDGNVWIASDAGLVIFHKEEMTLFKSRGYFGNRSITRVCCDQDGTVWVVAEGNLYRIRNRVIDAYGAEHGLPNNVIAAFLDNNGACWLHTDTQRKRLLRYTGDGFSVCPITDDVTLADVPTAVQDGEGNLWITSDTGLCSLQDLPCRTYTQTDGLPDSSLRSVCLDSSGRVWIGSSQAGVVVLRDGRMSPPGDAVLRSGRTNFMAAASDAMWLVHNGRLYNARGDVVVDATPRLKLAVGEHITVIAGTHTDRLWVGTDRGLIVLDSAGSRRYASITVPIIGAVSAIDCDSLGGVWIGSTGTLTHLSSGGYSTFAEGDGIPADPITAICSSSTKDCWFGTLGGGLYRLAGGRITRISVAHGLYSDEIQMIVDDGRGYLWIGSRRGVFRVSCVDLDRYSEGKETSITCDPYDADNGAAGGEVGEGNQSAGALDRNGILWVAAHGGLERIDTRHDTSHVAICRVEQARVNGTEYTPTEPITAAPGSGDLEIHYSALSFRASHQLVFTYRLDGADSDWVHAGTRRIAYYTHLPPGTYLFHVRAFNRDGAPTGRAATLLVTVNPHFYETVAFRLLGGMTIIVLIAISPMLWIRRLRRRNLALQRRVDARTQDLLTSNNSLTTAKEELVSRNEEIQDMAVGLEAQNEELAQARAELEERNTLLADTHARLEALATVDALTGIKNRRTFQQRLKDDWAYARRYQQEMSIILLDVDKFKQYNDTYGHPAGDEVLKAVAVALGGSVRDTDLLARYGGEEFIVILPQTSMGDAMLRAEALRHAIASIQGMQRDITASFGVSTMRPETINEQSLVSEADAALYRSKEEGRNRVTHFQALTGAVQSPRQAA